MQQISRKGHVLEHLNKMHSSPQKHTNMAAISRFSIRIRMRISIRIPTLYPSNVSACFYHKQCLHYIVIIYMNIQHLFSKMWWRENFFNHIYQSHCKDTMYQWPAMDLIYPRGHHMIPKSKIANTKNLLNTFSNKGKNIWNMIPVNIRNTSSIKNFKSLYKKYLFQNQI